MYYLQTKASFDAAHFLWKYEGKCRNIHGHRWNFVAKIKSQELEQEGQTRGMVVDFGNLKKESQSFFRSFFRLPKSTTIPRVCPSCSSS